MGWELQITSTAKETLEEEGLALGNTDVPIITPLRRSRRLDEKRGGQHYQIGQVGGSASRRKATQTELDTCTSKNALSIFNLIPNDILLSLDIDMGLNDNEYTNNLSQLRVLDSSRLEESFRAAKP